MPLFHTAQYSAIWPMVFEVYEKQRLLKTPGQPNPFDSDWAGPDVFVEHKGVIVYHCYNGDEMGPAHETHEFSLNTTCGNRRCTCGARCRFQFDVRTLPTYGWF